MTNERLRSRAVAAPDSEDPEPLLVDDGVVPAVPGLTWLPMHTYSPLITLFLRASSNLEQSISSDV